jgi:hypothetical protein
MITILRSINVSIFLTGITTILQYLPSLHDEYTIKILGKEISAVMLIIILFLILMGIFSLTYLSDIKVSERTSGLTLVSKILSLGPMLSSVLQMMFVGYIYIIMRRTGNFCGQVIDTVALKIEKVQSSISNLELFEKVTEMASISQEYKENLLEEITELSKGNLKQTKEAFMNMLSHANSNEEIRVHNLYKHMNDKGLLDYILPNIGIITLALIGTIIFYKFDVWNMVKNAITSYLTSEKELGDIIGGGFKAAANGVQLTAELAKNFIEYTVLNRSTLIAVRKLEEIVNSDINTGRVIQAHNDISKSQ